MPIVPDTKNWTWVIERPCPECGFDARSYTDASIASAIIDNATVWPAVLGRADVRARPNDSTWSPLEYAAHVRDVLLLYRVRIDRMRSEDDPLYDNWDQDATAIAERYNDQDPATVGVQLSDAAAALAAKFAELSGPEWVRTGRRSDGAAFTISSISRYLVHDIEHHSWDVAAV